ncbi:hypothetical protein V9T40_007274 [Parthenolecanium corni]|uniref:T-cell activation inhibitor, mitochondrial n=1 Tax=Parthenolecanium corni TaxID=536013 RepID=A0AAN9TY55_9HEMI
MVPWPLKAERFSKAVCPCGLNFVRRMSSSEIATALRPFYFSVHPDLFGQYPSERAVNENSLQMLSCFIENAKSSKPHPETELTFYLKPGKNKSDPRNLQYVKIKVGAKSLENTVSSILSSCNLPTAYVDQLKSRKPVKRKVFINDDYIFDVEDRNEDLYNVEFQLDRAIKTHLLKHWLQQNINVSREKLQKCEPVREEIRRLQFEIAGEFGIKELILDCGWNIRHYRGCLASFHALAHHHPQAMKTLKGRSLVFGRDTGISMDGHVLLNSGEVRHNWLDFIKKIPEEDAVLVTLPSFEKSVSRVLRDINVVRRKFQPQTMAKKYENNLKRLTTALSDHVGRYGYPKDWPEYLSDYDLVVETEAGPLMVSPTGQFIVPASCPSFLLINFITEHLDEAKKLTEHYQSHKHLEKDLQQKCVSELDLAVLQKDDCIPPDMMISCCSRLLRHKNELRELLAKSHLYVAKYYCVMSDGQLCIPWNWES